MALTGALAKLKSIVEENENRGKDRPKAKWLKLSAGQRVTVSFLNELDEDSSRFSESAGTALVAVEHTHPSNFKKKALCSKEEEGQCYGCEMAQEYPGEGWRGRARLYVNVLVEDGTDDPYVAVLSQGTSEKSITPALLEYAEDNGSITDVKFGLKRSGTGTATGYTLMPKVGTTPPGLEGLELFDLKETCTWTVPYEKQAEYYGPYSSKEEVAPPPEDSTSSEVDW